jgi:MFS transporter, DHA2 family, multidrug resistance protein
MLIAARALLGVADATIMPATLSITRNFFTDAKERTAAVGIASGVGALGVSLGPILGGVLLDHVWWGSVFLINAPITAVVLVAGLLVLPESRHPRPGRLDLPSVPLSIAGVLGVVYAIPHAARQRAHRGVPDRSGPAGRPAAGVRRLIGPVRWAPPMRRPR